LIGLDVRDLRFWAEQAKIVRVEAMMETINSMRIAQADQKDYRSAIYRLEWELRFALEERKQRQ